MTAKVKTRRSRNMREPGPWFLILGKTLIDPKAGIMVENAPTFPLIREAVKKYGANQPYRARVRRPNTSERIGMPLAFRSRSVVMEIKFSEKVLIQIIFPDQSRTMDAILEMSPGSRMAIYG